MQEAACNFRSMKLAEGPLRANEDFAVTFDSPLWCDWPHRKPAGIHKTTFLRQMFHRGFPCIHNGTLSGLCKFSSEFWQIEKSFARTQGEFLRSMHFIDLEMQIGSLCGPWLRMTCQSQDMCSHSTWVIRIYISWPLSCSMLPFLSYSIPHT